MKSVLEMLIKIMKRDFMNHEIERILLKNGASMVELVKIGELYSNVDLSGPRSEASVTEVIKLPQYPF